jgi:translation initiation factor 1
MTDTCLTCGLPKDLCVCESIAKEDQKIEVKLEKRKFGKPATVISGLDPKTIDFKDLLKKLKNKMACGGTVRENNTVELQGNHKSQIKASLVSLGFSADSIDVK